MRKNSQLLLAAISLFLSGCYSLPLSSSYSGPQSRPIEVQAYYGKTGKYHLTSEELVDKNSNYLTKKIILDSNFGPITIDYFQQKQNSENAVLVFPLLKGKPIVEKYFAIYFAEHGLDAVIVRRQNDFINPDNVDRLEEIIHDNVLRDRYVLDFLEEKYSKKQFASFGISRGAINAAITAGVDPRLKHNVFVLGGSNLPKLFMDSNQRRIKSYVANVTQKKNISREQFYEILKKSVKTDPKNLATFIDARHTLMVLGMFDMTVPIEYGEELRKQIGDPKTIFLAADHYSSLAFTQVICSFIPAFFDELCILPLDYIETEALEFYRESMGTKKPVLKLLPYRLLRAPFDILGRLINKIGS